MTLCSHPTVSTDINGSILASTSTEAFGESRIHSIDETSSDGSLASSDESIEKKINDHQYTENEISLEQIKNFSDIMKTSDIGRIQSVISN